MFCLPVSGFKRQSSSSANDPDDFAMRWLVGCGVREVHSEAMVCLEAARSDLRRPEETPAIN